MKFLRRTSLLVVLMYLPHVISNVQESAKPIVPVGIFLGRIEEGARIFTPIRLLPFDHPESMGHQFPNALQLYGTELDVLIWLGHQAGYELRTTLMRYPMQPSPTWPYKEFTEPDTSRLRTAEIIQRPAADSPLKGLRAILFFNRQPIGFMVDTRNLTLEERHMERPTSMGLDISRADFLDALNKVRKFIGDQRAVAVIFQRK